MSDSVLVAIDRGHTVVLHPRIAGQCAFFGGDFMAAPIGAFDDPYTGQCHLPAEYTMTDTDGSEADVCRHHATHVQVCSKCSPFVAYVQCRRGAA